MSATRLFYSCDSHSIQLGRSKLKNMTVIFYNCDSGNRQPWECYSTTMTVIFDNCGSFYRLMDRRASYWIHRDNGNLPYWETVLEKGAVPVTNSFQEQWYGLPKPNKVVLAFLQNYLFGHNRAINHSSRSVFCCPGMYPGRMYFFVVFIRDLDSKLWENLLSGLSHVEDGPLFDIITGKTTAICNQPDLKKTKYSVIVCDNVGLHWLR